MPRQPEDSVLLIRDLTTNFTHAIPQAAGTYAPYVNVQFTADGQSLILSAEGPCESYSLQYSLSAHTFTGLQGGNTCSHGGPALLFDELVPTPSGATAYTLDYVDDQDQQPPRTCLHLTTGTSCRKNDVQHWQDFDVQPLPAGPGAADTGHASGVATDGTWGPGSS